VDAGPSTGCHGGMGLVRLGKSACHPEAEDLQASSDASTPGPGSVPAPVTEPPASERSAPGPRNQPPPEKALPRTDTVVCGLHAKLAATAAVCGQLHRRGVATRGYPRGREHGRHVREQGGKADTPEPILPQPHPAGDARSERHHGMVLSRASRQPASANHKPRHQPS
jgi:hypothetical protein